MPHRYFYFNFDTLNRRLYTSNCRLYTSNGRLYSSKCRLYTSICRLYTSNCRLYPLNCRLFKTRDGVQCLFKMKAEQDFICDCFIFLQITDLCRLVKCIWKWSDGMFEFHLIIIVCIQSIIVSKTIVIEGGLFKFNLSNFHTKWRHFRQF